ncbi:CatB-related O-acetyltransferase [Candidatus Cetobacterium colombiensis]|uniref:CatB-related O-acetyltransferase n=1 Tax=Candidatus Cetobacterium colombiensis TaxID=3073100 RepID=A0ABU4W6U3_9FUSO|nr:CatB-related O-acetyltransferase [Candidatus Cetobacterium colombiensis]MDX8334910.1 CatB-related O-acetyltransferase [Candidatus Cetobacterium colombiensis]
MYRKLKSYLALYLFKKKWRSQNKHNQITPINKFPLEKVKVGKYSYGPIDVRSWGSSEEGLEIGNYVSIASGVKFILGGNHEINTFTTYPFKSRVFKGKIKSQTKNSSNGKIILKDDVWIGMDSTLISGITIGQGAIIAAGSFVTKDVLPYSIVGGNPAKIIKYRYSKEIIDEMIKIDWSSIDENKIKDIKEELYQPLNLELLKKIKKNLL